MKENSITVKKFTLKDKGFIIQLFNSFGIEFYWEVKRGDEVLFRGDAERVLEYLEDLDGEGVQEKPVDYAKSFDERVIGVVNRHMSKVLADVIHDFNASFAQT